MTSPSISIVIVNWNSREDVLAGIRSLEEQGEPRVQIVVVDNGSTDGSVQAIRMAHPDVLVIDTGQNLGFAEGCNRGIEVSNAEWVFLFNNDATADAGSLGKLREVAAEAAPDVGMIQPRLVFSQRPERVNSTGVLVFRNGTARDRHFNEPVEVTDEPAEIFCTTAGAALYRRSMLDQVRTPNGYLDRRFFMYYEDVDLGWRCRLAGWRALYVPQAVVRHRYQGSSSRRGKSFAIAYCKVNRINMLLKNASGPMLLQSMPKTVSDIWHLFWHHGPPAVWRTARAVLGATQERLQNQHRVKVPRRQIEEKWITLDEFPAPPLPRSP